MFEDSMSNWVGIVPFHAITLLRSIYAGNAFDLFDKVVKA